MGFVPAAGPDRSSRRLQHGRPLAKHQAKLGQQTPDWCRHYAELSSVGDPLGLKEKISMYAFLRTKQTEKY